MKLGLTAAIISSCMLSFAVSAQCEKNSAGQQYCVGDTVYTHYDSLAQVIKFNEIYRPVVMVLEGRDKAELQTFEIDLLYNTKQDCILEFCIGTKVRRHDQSDFSRKVVGLNKVLNTVMYTNTRNKKYSVKPGQLVSINGPQDPRPVPGPGPTPGPDPRPTPNPTPVGGSWSMDDSINTNGNPAAQASVGAQNNDTALIMSCEAPSEDMKLKIRLDETYRSVVADVVNDPKQLLFVQLIVDSEEIELTSWELQGTDLIAQSDALYPDEVSRIKKGSSLKLVILSDTSSDSDQDVIIHEQSFSLKGSHAAITSAQEYCSSNAPKN